MWPVYFSEPYIFIVRLLIDTYGKIENLELFPPLILTLLFSNIRFIIFNCLNNITQIYHVWEGYLRKIPVLRLNFPRYSEGYLRKIPVERRTISLAEWRGKFSLKTGTPRKYPSQTWYIWVFLFFFSFKFQIILFKNPAI